MKDKNIEDIMNNIGKEAVPPDVYRTGEQMSREFAESLEKQSEHHILFTRIASSRITRLAAAAAIIAGVFIWVSQLGGSGIAWADVVNSVERAMVLSYRLRTSISGFDEAGPTETESIVYNSRQYGIRADAYMNGKVVSSSYMNPDRKVLITVVPETKMYMQMPLTSGQLDEYYQKNDPRHILRKCVSGDYTQLGRDKINGVEVEGIEVNNPAFMQGAFENVVIRVWADVETEFPVRVKVDGVAGSDVRIKIVMEDFKLVDELGPDYFKPNIPADYTMMGVPEGADSSSEERAVDALRGFAKITGGVYPSSLAIATAMSEAGKALKESGRDQNDEQEVKRMMSNLMNVPAACTFYTELIRNNEEVEYYGDVVTADDADAVLLRWRVSEDRYRVIFGDLSSADVSSEELAELEGSQKQ